MRFLLFTVLAIIVWSCNPRSKSSSIDKFVVKKYSIALDIKVLTTLFYKGHYFCLTDEKRFICLNDKFEVDSSMTNSINQLRVDFSFISGDSLIAGVYSQGIEPYNYFLNSDLKWERIELNRKEDQLFEDEKFIVTACCFGEFGGSVFFTDKKSNRVYSCAATCATTINKLDECYFVTVSLAHESGSTIILKIEDPTKLVELRSDRLKHFCNWWVERLDPKDYVASREKFMVGAQEFIDTLGLLTLTSFVFNDQIYHINSDRNNTFISKVKGDKFVQLDSIFNEYISSSEPKSRKCGNKQLISFRSRNASGFLSISNDTISAITFGNRKKNRYPQKQY